VADTQTDVEKLVAAFAGPAQDVENVLQQLLLQRWIDTAVGVQLDQLGKIVGQAREGRDDDDYRRFIRARILTNRSDGRFETLITIALLVLNEVGVTIRVTDEGTATCRVYATGAVTGDTAGAILATFMQLAVGGGVRVVTQWEDSTASGIFRFDSGPGFDVGHLSADEDDLEP